LLTVGCGLSPSEGFEAAGVDPKRGNPFSNLSGQGAASNPFAPKITAPEKAVEKPAETVTFGANGLLTVGCGLSPSEGFEAAGVDPKSGVNAQGRFNIFNEASSRSAGTGQSILEPFRAGRGQQSSLKILKRPWAWYRAKFACCHQQAKSYVQQTAQSRDFIWRKYPVEYQWIQLRGIQYRKPVHSLVRWIRMDCPVPADLLLASLKILKRPWAWYRAKFACCHQQAKSYVQQTAQTGRALLFAC
jgi:hypothetical protein